MGVGGELPVAVRAYRAIITVLDEAGCVGMIPSDVTSTSLPTAERCHPPFYQTFEEEYA